MLGWWRNTLLVFVLTGQLTYTAIADSGRSKVKWSPWSDGVFAKAKSEGRLVLLDLEAVWCHWCHVMDQETYSRDDVSGLLNAKFISLRVDQDSRPDLSLRYQDYGWPATIIFNADGKELLKRAGFIEPAEMMKFLQQAIAQPNTVIEGEEQEPKEFSKESVLREDLRSKLEEKHYSAYDPELGSLRLSHKYLDSEHVEFSLTRAASGSARDSEIVRRTLTNNLKLVDPAWGGVYQYSTHRDWDHPHFEKIVSTQAKNLRLYAVSSNQFDDKSYREAAKQIYSYLKHFLMSPEGAFYTSQDADLVKGVHSSDYFKLNDAERRKQGTPAIDKHRYARENGRLIAALTEYYGATGDAEALRDAVRAAEWVIANRSIAGGGFRHDEADVAGPFLGDTLAMGEAALELYAATGERRWSTVAEGALNFIRTTFVERDPKGGEIPGFITAKSSPAAVLPTVRDTEENVGVARFANLMHRYFAKPEFRSASEHAMRYLGTPEIALEYRTNSGILIADNELRSDPLHITIVGKRDDTATKSLYQAALRFPSMYRRVELWDRREGPLPNLDVSYPELPKPAAFICTAKRCSLPIFKPEEIATTIKRIAATT